MDIMKKLGYNPFIQNLFKNLRYRPCFRLGLGDIDRGFDKEEYYKDRGYEIVNFSDLIFPEDKTVILDAEETVVEPYTEPKFGDVLECVEKYEDFHVGEKCIITDISYWYADLESEDSCGQIRKDLLENHFKLIRRL